MKVLLTGGGGDLGRLLVPALIARGDEPVIFDLRSPSRPAILGSITDRRAVRHALEGAECVIHIAALHGIHEFRRTHNEYDFWDVNVTGTFNVFQGAAEAGIKKMLFISSTSVEEWPGVYGSSKIHGEEIARTYSQRHEMNVLTLRPRAFIPPWNKEVYSSYIDWARWFWGGAVHIVDVVNAILAGLDYISSAQRKPHRCITLDGAYEYSESDLREWDREGKGTTFLKYCPEYLPLVKRYDLDPSRKPKRMSDPQVEEILGVTPTFSLRTLLFELEEFGEEGPSEEYHLSLCYERALRPQP